MIRPKLFYDYNIWSQGKGSLNLTAHEWEYVNGLQTNSNKFYTITFKAPADIAEIEYLLDDMYINQFPLTDYDTWEGLEFLTRGNSPARIQEFLDDLPDYEVPNYNKEEAYL
jgi:hypothetical protein